MQLSYIFEQLTSAEEDATETNGLRTLQEFSRGIVKLSRPAGAQRGVGASLSFFLPAERAYEIFYARWEIQ
jgi:hypothetical protein